MFPRKEGKAKYYRVFENEEVDDSTFGITIDHGERVLLECKRLGYDLVYGDCVKVGNSNFTRRGIMMYNGEKIIHLEYDEGDYNRGLLIPKEFTVIKHERTSDYIPPKYYVNFFSGVFNFPSEIFQNKEFTEDKVFKSKNIPILREVGDEEYYYIKIENNIVIACETTCIDITLLNKLIHSGISISTTSFDEVDDLYHVMFTKEEMKKIEDN